MTLVLLKQFKNQKAIASLMKNITLSMKLDIAKYHNSQTIMDVFKIYFDQEEKIYLLINYQPQLIYLSK